MVAKDYDHVNSDLLVGKMANRLPASDVLQLWEDDEFGLSEEDDSDFEGESVEGYLPRMDLELCPVENIRLWDSTFG